MGGFELGFARGAQIDEEQRLLAREQRAAKLAPLLNDASISDADKEAAVKAVYQQDPGLLKQHVENLFRRMGGRQTQPMVQPGAQAQQTLQGIAAKAVPQEQQDINRYKGQVTAQQGAQLEGNQKLMQWIQSLPEDQRQLAEQISGVSATRPQWKLYRLADGSTQYFDPSQAPAGAQPVSSATNAIKGTMVKSKQSPTGYAQTWVDRSNPNKIVAWQPISPSRWYTGFTSSSTTVDPFGVSSTTSRVTNPAVTGDIDLTGITQMPPELGADPAPGMPAPTASPQAAPASPVPQKQPAPRTTSTKKGASTTQPDAQAQLDANGHIPEGTANPQLIQAANQLLDGMDLGKLQLPQRDKQAAAELASKYGWRQGAFTPRELSLVEESRSLIRQIKSDPKAFESVYKANPLKRGLIAHLISTKGAESFMGAMAKAVSSAALSQDDVNFIQTYRQLLGRIQGIAQLTRGSGRPTEAAIQRMIGELPDPMIVQSPEQARHSFELIEDEIDTALKAVKTKAPAPKTKPQSSDPVDNFLRSFPSGEQPSQPR